MKSVTWKNIQSLLLHPNMLTLYRVAAIPAIVILLVYENKFCSFLAAIFFCLAAITDFLDGFQARRKGLVSEFGKNMDPLADKLLVSSSLIMMTSIGWIPGWMVCIIIGRELIITGLRTIISDKGKDTSASVLGKYKTGFQIAAIIPLLVHYSYLGIDFHAIGMFFFWCAFVLTIWSGGDYLFKNKDLIKPTV